MGRPNGPGEAPTSNVLPFNPRASFGPNGVQVESLLLRAARLSRVDVALLDGAEATDHAMLIAAWDRLRDRLRDEPERSWRFAAREAAWRAYENAADRLGLERPPADDYWRVAQGVGFGAVRVVRYAACALVATEKLDPEISAILLRPWRSVVTQSPHS